MPALGLDLDLILDYIVGHLVLGLCLIGLDLCDPFVQPFEDKCIIVLQFHPLG